MKLKLSMAVFAAFIMLGAFMVQPILTADAQVFERNVGGGKTTPSGVRNLNNPNVFEAPANIYWNCEITCTMPGGNEQTFSGGGCNDTQSQQDIIDREELSCEAAGGTFTGFPRTPACRSDGDCKKPRTSGSAGGSVNGRVIR